MIVCIWLKEIVRKPGILGGGTGRSHAALHIARELHPSSWREQTHMHEVPRPQLPQSGC